MIRGANKLPRFNCKRANEGETWAEERHAPDFVECDECGKRVREGDVTTIANGQGLCLACFEEVMRDFRESDE